jgi:hypothetical protein
VTLERPSARPHEPLDVDRSIGTDILPRGHASRPVPCAAVTPQPDALAFLGVGVERRWVTDCLPRLQATFNRSEYPMGDVVADGMARIVGMLSRAALVRKS